MSAPDANNPIYSEAEQAWFQVTPGEKFTIRTSVRDTQGLYTMIELVADPHNGVPMHVHTREDECFIVLEGAVDLVCGDQKLTLSAGDSATVKRGTPHAWGNLSDHRVRMLIVFSPGHIERTFRFIGDSKDHDVKSMLDSNESDGSFIVGPSPFDRVYTVLSPRPAESN